MDTWTQLEAELSDRKRDKKWLAERLGIAQIQTIDHWKNRGIPHKYRPLIDELFGIQQTTPLTVDHDRGTGFGNITLSELGELLANADAQSRETAAMLLDGLARNPRTLASVCKGLAAVLDDCDCDPKANRKAA